MCDNPVVFVAFEEQDNLGVGYIASVLSEAGFNVKILDFRIGKERVLENIVHYEPLVVGFSIIFQYHIYDFKDLVTHLRERGVTCHFSAGGHYPSLRFNELFDLIPELNSVVLFEGEYTFLNLVQCVCSGKQWKNVKGIAHKQNGTVVANALRPLEKDLDKFPPPVRTPLREYSLGKKYATIIASRGCYYNCGFCSIREFYSKPPGPVKRIRRPEMTVREMELLHEQLDCSIFMFQDDDFPIAGRKGKEWVTKFCMLLTEKGLVGKILWKINCRPDEVQVETFRLMKNAGLFLVYLGIEDGTDDGLRSMNKHMTAEVSFRAIETLKELEIGYDFGFMLFHPSTTYQSVLENLHFLERVCGDGSSPVTFCKMLPYAETKVEHQLRSDGRLKGKPGFEDYDFLHVSLNHFYSFTANCFEDWIGKHDGLLNIARWARYCLAVYREYFPMTPAFRKMEKSVNEVISHSNTFFINTARTLVFLFGSDREDDIDALGIIAKDIALKHSAYRAKLVEVINNIENMVN
jgi:radical SAM superfamily enzyme YgiQ (UPF0313 family)